jgi:hypothetical protein
MWIVYAVVIVVGLLMLAVVLSGVLSPSADAGISKRNKDAS